MNNIIEEEITTKGTHAEGCVLEVISSKCWEKGRSLKVRMTSQGTMSSWDLYVILWQEPEIRGDEWQGWQRTFVGNCEAMVHSSTSMVQPQRPSPGLLWWKAETASATSSSPTRSSNKSPGHTAHQNQRSLFWILPSVQVNKIRWLLLSEVCIVESMDSFFCFCFLLQPYYLMAIFRLYNLKFMTQLQYF